MGAAPPPTDFPLLLLHRLPTYGLSILSTLWSKYTVLEIHTEPPDPSFHARSKTARILLCVGRTPLTSDDLEKYPAVACVVGSSAGLDHIDLAACRRRGIRVTGAGEALSDDVADYAVGLAIDIC